MPTKGMQVIPPVWPLARWGIDIVGPLPKGHGNLAFAIVTMESFTKWPDVEPVASITA